MLSVSTAGKRQCADLRAIATVLQEKRHRLASEEEDSRASRLESLRDNFAERMEVETEEESSARLEHMSHLQQLRLSTEVDEERAARLENMSHNRDLRCSSELDKDRAEGSEHQQHRSGTRLKLDWIDISPCSNSIMFNPECATFTRKLLQSSLQHAPHAWRSFQG